MENERKLLINTFENHKAMLQAALNKPALRTPKVQHHSRSVRQEGNTLYKKENHGAQTHLKILSHYSRSIALALSNSEELALGYGNRSAFLLHIGKNKESIQDIDRAVEITSSKILKAKLLCRKVKCLKMLGLSGYKSILEEIKSWIDKISENDGNKKQLLNMMDEAKEFPNNNEKNTMKEDKNKSKVLKILSCKESEDVLQSVNIMHDEKFGRHLVAVRDFQPGEIIFVEKMYTAVLNDTKYYTNCYYCLKICWSGIPCDHCIWAMFCSETCKTEAWNKYHDLECSVLPYASILSEDSVDNCLLDTHRISLRKLIVGIKEAGSISKLKVELESVDECSGTAYRGFLMNGKIISNSFKSAYSLKSKEIVNPCMLEMWAMTSIRILISLIKNTSLFGKSFKYKRIQDLIQNEEVLFLGSLLIKLIKIKENNTHGIARITHCCEYSNDNCNKNSCCERGNCIAPLTCLINHSCFPNVTRCFTEDKKVIIFAVQPIKKNCQKTLTHYEGQLRGD